MVDVVAQAIQRVDVETMNLSSVHPHEVYRRMAQAAIDALNVNFGADLA